MSDSSFPEMKERKASNESKEATEAVTFMLIAQKAFEMSIL